MYEWSETDLMIRDSVRAFIDKEIRPNLALEALKIPPAPDHPQAVRRLRYRRDGARGRGEAVGRERARAAGEVPGAASGRSAGGKGDDDAATDSDTGSGGAGFGGQDSLMAVVTSELSGVCMGLVSAMGVSLGLGAATIASRGTLETRRSAGYRES